MKHVSLILLFLALGRNLSAQPSDQADHNRPEVPRVELREALAESDRPFEAWTDEKHRALPAAEQAAVEVSLLAQASLIASGRGQGQRAHQRMMEARSAALRALAEIPAEDRARRSRVHFQVGILEEWGSRDLAESARAYRQALQEDPDNSAAQLRLAKVEARLRIRGIE